LTPGADSVEIREVPQVVVAGEPPVEAALAPEHEADTAANVVRLADHVMAALAPCPPWARSSVVRI